MFVFVYLCIFTSNQCVLNEAKISQLEIICSCFDVNFVKYMYQKTPRLIYSWKWGKGGNEGKYTLDYLGSNLPNLRLERKPCHFVGFLKFLWHFNLRGEIQVVCLSIWYLHYLPRMCCVHFVYTWWERWIRLFKTPFIFEKKTSKNCMYYV